MKEPSHQLYLWEISCCHGLLDTIRQQLPHNLLGEVYKSLFVSVASTGESSATSSKRKKYIEGVQEEMKELRLVMMDLLHSYQESSE